MDHILIINRIGRTLMTVTTHSSTQSFEIPPGAITTSVRKEPYGYDACPFTYSKVALGGRLEIWDCTGRLVYSWQRTYPSVGAQLQRPSVGLKTPSQTPCSQNVPPMTETRAQRKQSLIASETHQSPRSGPEIKTEENFCDLQVTGEKRVQQKPSPIAPVAPSQMNHGDSPIHNEEVPKPAGTNANKRKRPAATGSNARKTEVATRGLSRAAENPSTSLTYSN